MKFIGITSRNGSWTWMVPIIGILLVISLLSYNRQHQKKQAIHTYYETKKALQLLVFNLDKGKTEMAQLCLFEDSIKKIYNH